MFFWHIFLMLFPSKLFMSYVVFNHNRIRCIDVLVIAFVLFSFSQCTAYASLCFFYTNRRRDNTLYCCVHFMSHLTWGSCFVFSEHCSVLLVVVFISGFLRQQLVFVSTHAVVQRTYSRQHNDKRLTECNYIHCDRTMGWAMHYAYTTKTDQTVDSVECATVYLFERQNSSLWFNEIEGIFSIIRYVFFFIFSSNHWR